MRWEGTRCSPHLLGHRHHNSDPAWTRLRTQPRGARPPAGPLPTSDPALSADSSHPRDAAPPRTPRGDTLTRPASPRARADPCPQTPRTEPARSPAHPSRTYRAPTLRQPAPVLHAPRTHPASTALPAGPCGWKPRASGGGARCWGCVKPPGRSLWSATPHPPIHRGRAERSGALRGSRHGGRGGRREADPVRGAGVPRRDQRGGRVPGRGHRHEVPPRAAPRTASRSASRTLTPRPAGA